jgi:hypothetical protein
MACTTFIDARDGAQTRMATRKVDMKRMQAVVHVPALDAIERRRASARADPSVVFCGNRDNGLAEGNGVIPAETDQANGLPQDPLKPAQAQGPSSVETTNSHSHNLPVGPLTLPRGPSSAMIR